MSAAVQLEARRRQRAVAGEPTIVHARPTVAVVIDPLDDADEAVGVALAVRQHPELAERIELETVGHAQALDEALHLRAVGVHADDDAGAAAAGHLAVGALQLHAVVADTHVEHAVGAEFQHE